nr:ORF1 [Afoambidensovirus incertum 1]
MSQWCGTGPPRGTLICKDKLSFRKYLQYDKSLIRHLLTSDDTPRQLIVTYDTTRKIFTAWHDYDPNLIKFPIEAEQDETVTAFRIKTLQLNTERFTQNFQDDEDLTCEQWTTCLNCYLNFFEKSNPAWAVNPETFNHWDILAEDNCQVTWYKYHSLTLLKYDLVHAPSYFWCTICDRPRFQIHHDNFPRQIIWPCTNDFLTQRLLATKISLPCK